MPVKKSNEEFLAELKEKNPSIIPLEPYINSQTKIDCECQVCGNRWSVAPGRLLHDRGCPVCGKEKGAIKRRSTIEEFTEKLHAIQPDIEVVGKYINSTTKIAVHCKKCDNRWLVVPSSLLRGTGCPKCNKRYRRKPAEFAAEVRAINPHIRVLSPFINTHEKVQVRCERCGNEWLADPNGLLKGNDCPVCGHSSTSIAEQLLFNAFVFLVGENNVLNRDKTAIGEELDVYIPYLKLAIEYGAWFWHENKTEKDVKKEQLCEQAGIHLITVYEGCPEGTRVADLKEAIYYSHPISNEKEYTTVKELLLKLCEEYDLNCSIILEQWAAIVKISKESSRKKDTETFVKELASVNPTIKYIKSYKGSKEPVRVQCLKCGLEWNASSAYGLLHGKGCPECGKDKRNQALRMSPTAFEMRVREVNPQIALLEEYHDSKSTILCKCMICGTEWRAKPESIRYEKRNCPACAKNTKRSNEDFLKALAKVSKKITPLEEYVNSATKIRFKCEDCDYVWAARPNDVLKGTGCPRCAHRLPMTHEEFVKKLHEINKTIEVQGNYIDTKTKLKCHCRKCGYIWFGIPGNLIKGAGCPKCAGTLRLSHKEFVRKLEAVNSSVIPIEQYINNKTRLLCRCKACGFEWKASPNNLLNGHGCPSCKAQQAGERRARKVACVETGTVYTSITEAKRETGISTISDCLNHRTKTAGGYHWTYV